MILLARCNVWLSFLSNMFFQNSNWKISMYERTYSLGSVLCSLFSQSKWKDVCVCYCIAQALSQHLVNYSLRSHSKRYIRSNVQTTYPTRISGVLLTVTIQLSDCNLTECSSNVWAIFHLLRPSIICYVRADKWSRFSNSSYRRHAHTPITHIPAFSEFSVPPWEILSIHMNIECHYSNLAYSSSGS